MTDKQQDLRLPGGIVAVGVTDAEARILAGRKIFVENYCRERGWEVLSLTLPQILEIRAQPGWKSPA